MQLAVSTPAGAQLRMLAAFHDLPLVQYQDLMSLPNCTQSMSDDEACASFKQDSQRTLQAGFGLSVDAARGFIQDQDSRGGQQRTSEANQLTLSGLKLRPALAHVRLQAFAQRR